MAHKLLMQQVISQLAVSHKSAVISNCRLQGHLGLVYMYSTIAVGAYTVGVVGVLVLPGRHMYEYMYVGAYGIHVHARVQCKCMYMYYTITQYIVCTIQCTMYPVQCRSLQAQSSSPRPTLRAANCMTAALVGAAPPALTPPPGMRPE